MLDSVEGEGISDEWAKPPSNVGENTMMEAAERGISDVEPMWMGALRFAAHRRARLTLTHEQADEIEQHVAALEEELATLRQAAQAHYDTSPGEAAWARTKRELHVVLSDPSGKPKEEAGG